MKMTKCTSLLGKMMTLCEEKGGYTGYTGIVPVYPGQVLLVGVYQLYPPLRGGIGVSSPVARVQKWLRVFAIKRVKSVL